MPQFLQVTPRLLVRDVPATVAFYTKMLGFDLEVAWPETRPTFVILRRDAAALGFFERTNEASDSVGDAELYLRVTDATALHADLKERVRIEWGPDVYSYGCREFALRDPDGYLVIFTEPTDDPPTTNEP